MSGALYHVKSNPIADFTGTVTAMNSAGSTVTRNATDLVRPSDWNSGHKMDVTISGNTSGQSTAAGVTNMVFQGGNNVTLALSTAALAATMHVIAGAGPVMSKWEPTPPTGTQLVSLGQNSLHFLPLWPRANASFTCVNMVLSISTVTSSISHSVGHTFSYGLYAPKTGASSTQIEPLSTSSGFLAASYSSNLSGGYTINMNGSSTTVSSAGTGFGSVLSGLKQIALPLAGSMSAGGEYYFAVANSSNSVGGTGALRMSFLVNNPLSNASMGRIFTNGVSISNASYKMDLAGFLASTSNGFTTIGDTERRIWSNVRPHVIFEA